MALRTLLVLLLPLLVVAAASAEPLRLVFWQESDIRDGVGVRLEAHPFSPRKRVDLLRGDPKRPSLWYNPAAAVPVGDDIYIYYQRVESKQPDYTDQRTLCVGVLGPHGFTLPDLKLFPQGWPGPANVVLTRSPHKPTWGGFNVFQIVPDPDGSLQMLYWDQPAQGEAGGMLARSSDGLRWTKDPSDKAVFTEHNDAYTLVRSQRGDEWLLYQTRLEPWPDKPLRDNLPGLRRVISLRRSRDLTSWTPQELVLAPDAKDATTAEFYFLKAFRYAGRYVGVIMKYYADPKLPGRHSGIYRMELVFSADGVRWERPYRAEDIGVWSYADPFKYRGELCMVAYSRNAMSLFRTRVDGLASCGSSGVGSFSTQPFVAPRADLTLNADCRQGRLAAEVLDAAGQPVPGYEADQCRFEGKDSTALPLRWGERGLAALAGRTVHLRFTLRNARVYAVTEAPARAVHE